MNTVENQPRDIGKLSEEIFIRASMKYATSVPAQGMYISLECRRFGIGLDELKSELLKPERLEKFSQIAERSHHRLTDDYKPTITPRRISGIINNNILMAKRVSTIPTQMLQDKLDTSWSEYSDKYKDLSKIERSEEADAYFHYINNWADEESAKILKLQQEENFRQKFPLLARIRRIFS